MIKTIPTKNIPILFLEVFLGAVLQYNPHVFVNPPVLKSVVLKWHWLVLAHAVNQKADLHKYAEQRWKDGKTNPVL